MVAYDRDCNTHLPCTGRGRVCALGGRPRLRLATEEREDDGWSRGSASVDGA